MRWRFIPAIMLTCLGAAATVAGLFLLATIITPLAVERAVWRAAMEEPGSFLRGVTMSLSLLVLGCAWILAGCASWFRWWWLAIASVLVGVAAWIVVVFAQKT